MKLLKLIGLSLFLYGCASQPAGTTAYQSILTTETGVVAANSAFLDWAVTTGNTNSVPKVEAVFNDTQLVLHTAAALSSGGSTAPVSPAVFAKAVAFTNSVNSAEGK